MVPFWFALAEPSVVCILFNFIVLCMLTDQIFVTLSGIHPWKRKTGVPSGFSLCLYITNIQVTCWSFCWKAAPCGTLARYFSLCKFQSSAQDCEHLKLRRHMRSVTARAKGHTAAEQETSSSTAESDANIPLMLQTLQTECVNTTKCTSLCKCSSLWDPLQCKVGWKVLAIWTTAMPHIYNGNHTRCHPHPHPHEQFYVTRTHLWYSFFRSPSLLQLHWSPVLWMQGNASPAVQNNPSWVHLSLQKHHWSPCIRCTAHQPKSMAQDSLSNPDKANKGLCCLLVTCTMHLLLAWKNTHTRSCTEPFQFPKTGRKQGWVQTLLRIKQSTTCCMQTNFHDILKQGFIFVNFTAFYQCAGTENFASKIHIFGNASDFKNRKTFIPGCIYIVINITISNHKSMP